MKLNLLRPLGLSAVLLLGTAPAAFALDAADFAAKIKSLYTVAGIDVTLGAGTVNGSDIVYDGLTVTMPGDAGADNTMKIDTKLDFTNVTAQADGSYRADALKLPDIDVKVEDSETTVKNISFAHILVPSTKTPTIVDVTQAFANASIGPIAVVGTDGSALHIDSVNVNNTFKPAQGDPALAEIDGGFTTSGMTFDLSQKTDPETLKQAQAWGLTTLTGKAQETLTWTLKDGHLNMSELSLDVDKVGKLNFNFDITGYTPQLAQSLASLKDAFAPKAGASGDQSQSAVAMVMGALQTLFINSTSIRFDDASITGKVLDYFVKQAGSTKDAFIDQVVTQMPAMDKDSSDPTPPEVMKMMQAATRAYLTDPHSIELKLAPKTPLGVLGIMGAVMAPTNLGDQIGLQVLVNDKQITAEQAAKETGVAPPSSDDSSSAPSTDDSTTTPSSGDDSTAAPSDDSTSGSDDSSTSSSHGSNSN